jgi:hypothetical protein
MNDAPHISAMRFMISRMNYSKVKPNPTDFNWDRDVESDLYLRGSTFFVLRERIGDKKILVIRRLLLTR